MSPEFNPSSLQKYILTELGKAVSEEDVALDAMKLEDSADSINYARIKTQKLYDLHKQAELIGIPRYNILKVMIGSTREDERKKAINMWYNSNSGVSEEVLKRICIDFNIDCDF